MDAYESRPEESFELQPSLRRRARRKQGDFQVERDLLPYQIVLQGKPIRLAPAEYRFLLCLAQRPYHAFRVREVLEAVNQGDEPEITEEALRALVKSLRDKLGFFWDYVQHVPYIGYRFRP